MKYIVIASLTIIFVVIVFPKLFSYYNSQRNHIIFMSNDESHIENFCPITEDSTRDNCIKDIDTSDQRPVHGYACYGFHSQPVACTKRGFLSFYLNQFFPFPDDWIYAQGPPPYSPSLF